MNSFPSFLFVMKKEGMGKKGKKTLCPTHNVIRQEDTNYCLNFLHSRSPINLYSFSVETFLRKG